MLLHLSMVGPARALEGEIAVDLSGLLPYSIDAVREVLLDFSGYPRWFPAVAEFRLLAREGHRALVYGRQAFPWPVADRDYVVRYQWSDGEGGFDLEATLVPDGLPAPPVGVIRVRSLVTRWELSRAGACTRARYSYRGESGPLGEWLGEQLLRVQAQRVIEGLSEAVGAQGRPRNACQE